MRRDSDERERQLALLDTNLALAELNLVVLSVALVLVCVGLVMLGGPWPGVVGATLALALLLWLGARVLAALVWLARSAARQAVRLLIAALAERERRDAPYEEQPNLAIAPLPMAERLEPSAAGGRRYNAASSLAALVGVPALYAWSGGFLVDATASKGLIGFAVVLASLGGVIACAELAAAHGERPRIRLPHKTLRAVLFAVAAAGAYAGHEAWPLAERLSALPVEGLSWKLVAAALLLAHLQLRRKERCW